MIEPARIRPAWVIIALLVSLAANGLLIGYVIGRGMMPVLPALPAASAPVPVNNVAERLKRLPRAERQKFQDAMKPFRPGLGQARADLVDARGQLVQALLTEPYDVGLMRRAFANIRAKTSELQRQVQDATAQALASLTPQSRKGLATQ